MTYPTSYSRTKDFTDEVGSATDHIFLNAELDAIALSVQQIIANLKLIQRADNELANDSVGLDQLEPGIGVTVIEGSQELLDAKDAAVAAAATAEAWATTAEDAEVETGLYSALHYAAKAADSAASALTSAKPKNLLINGNFKIAQRASLDMAAADNTYATADRWRHLGDGTTLYSAATANGGSVTNQALVIHPNTANKKFGVIQIIEHYDAINLRGKTLTLTARMKGTAGIDDVRMAILEFSGTGDSVSGDPVSAWNASGTNPTWAANWAAVNTPANLSVGTSFGTHSATVTLGTTFTNLAVAIWSNSTTPTSSDDLSIEHVQLEVGDEFSEFEQRPLADEWTLCQRYYEKTTTFSGGGMVAYAAGAAYFPRWQFKARKRTSSPVCSLSNVEAYLGGGWNNLAAFSKTIAGDYDGALVSLSAGSGLTAGNGYLVRLNSGYLVADAEL